MVYNPRHINDLESGAIVMATIRQGDDGDTVDLPKRVMDTNEILGTICNDPDQKTLLRSLTADKSYFGVDEVCCLQERNVRVIIGDPHAPSRNAEKQSQTVRSVLNKARGAVWSKSRKIILRKRGEHLERSFCYVADHGGLRRVTQRGVDNLPKRWLEGALAYNLSFQMRHMTGVGTPKQWLAGVCYLSATIWGHCPGSIGAQGVHDRRTRAKSPILLGRKAEFQKGGGKSVRRLSGH
jgi:hypothetical protein